jgi:hypothetical protein
LRNSDGRSRFWGFEEIRTKQPRFWVCEKNQNERTTGFGYLKNLKELLGFMKEPEKK